MSRARRSRQSGFTLIELLVVISIIGILIAMLLPAVQAAREAARRMQCSNNLKQLCLSLHTFENGYRRLPMGDFKPPFWPTRHGLWQQVLPYIEQKPLYDQYRWDVNWYDPGNASAVGTHLNVMQCASSGSPNRLTSGTEAGVNWAASATDYFGISGVDGKLATYLGLTNADPRGVLTKKDSSINRFADVVDGTSNTIALTECAGRPQLYRAGMPASGTLNRTGWADHATGFDPKGYSFDGTLSPGPCTINCSNDKAIYSFHVGGANVAFADGSARFLRATIDPGALVRLITRAGGEVVTGDF